MIYNFDTQSEPADSGWTSPWTYAGDSANARLHCIQNRVTDRSELALEMAAQGSLERHFPQVSAGTLSIELSVRLEQATTDVTDYNASVLKVYAGDAQDRWAFRWHYPFAWPEVGGNTFPRFYVIDGQGEKRKGIEPTALPAEPKRWYATTAILDFLSYTWIFTVDGNRVTVGPKSTYQMAWWQHAGKGTRLCKLRLNSAAAGKNWIDRICIRHDGIVIA